MNYFFLQLFILPVVTLSSSLHKEPFLIDHQMSDSSSFYQSESPAQPNFAEKDGNVTTQIGGTVFIHCPVVSSTGDNRAVSYPSISWVRLRDWMILTNGVFTITSDDRFSVLHKEGTFDWILQVKYAQESDAGAYECQVSTSTGKISRRVYLDVVTPVAFILGGDEYHINSGSQISLVCVIEKAPEPPQYVFWYHEDNMVNYESVRGITVHTISTPEKTQSRLNIVEASPSDSGKFTCKPANTRPASIMVFVSEERVDKMEALHKQSSSLLINTPTHLSNGGKAKRQNLLSWLFPLILTLVDHTCVYVVTWLKF